MRQEGAHGRRHDDGERRSDRKVHADRVVDAEQPEDLIEYRHEDRPAANAEKAGKQPGDHTGGGKRQGKHHQFRNRRHGMLHRGSGNPAKERNIAADAPVLSRNGDAFQSVWRGTRRARHVICTHRFSSGDPLSGHRPAFRRPLFLPAHDRCGAGGPALNRSGGNRSCVSSNRSGNDPYDRDRCRDRAPC
ncbi:hypothetical protein D9M72_522260 [compost metagenome]